MTDSVRIIPLGGFDKIGMNMTLIESKDSIIAIDCGMSFPPDNMPGVTAMIPDTTYLEENRDKFKGIVLTHGHEDHIGALPYILGEMKVPVYGTPLTIALVEKRLSDFGIKGIKTRVIKQGATIVVGDFKVEFIKASHSIPDSAMLAIYTPLGIIFNTGDFKLDMTPVTGKMGDISRITALGSKGVLAVLSDSTNAMTEGFSRSELYVYEQLDVMFSRYRGSRLIIVTFATNMDRIQQIINLAGKYGRKMVMEGELMLEVFSEAGKLGYVDVPEDMIVSADRMNDYEDGEIIFLTTGSHGKSVQCISEIAQGSHPGIRIKENDVVLFSSIAIHGNEVEFNRTLNSLEEQGATVVFQDLHATGHACAEELKLLFAVLHPSYVIPAHGEYRYRREAKRIAAEVGIPAKNIFLIDNGDVVELARAPEEQSDSDTSTPDDITCSVTDHISLHDILVDGSERTRIDRTIIRDRERLSESGVVVIEVCIDKMTGRLASGINITSRGFVDEKKYQGLKGALETAVSGEIARCIGQGVRDERMSRGVERIAKDLIKDNTGKGPIVIVLITDVML
ncbi:ribonuclease J [Butyrivibrio sp. FCS014]|uniref:ribonuclease J n=1 Tax=Butyrivibrio sp. FCS014 TaxID=1408304 RepID=UPI000464C182|nr:ribonuclease J [Butyrivibrio sp. FCS014]